MSILRTVTRPSLVLLVASFAVVIISTSAQAFEEDNEGIIGEVKREVANQEDSITKRGWPDRRHSNPFRRGGDSWRRGGSPRPMWKSKREAPSKRQTKLDLGLSRDPFGNNGLSAGISHTRGNHRFSAGVSRSGGRNSYSVGYERSFARGRGRFNVGVQRSSGSRPSFGAGFSYRFG